MMGLVWDVGNGPCFPLTRAQCLDWFQDCGVWVFASRARNEM